MTDIASLPVFDDLPVIEALGLKYAWDFLDKDLGTLSLISKDDVKAAASLVSTGEVLPLNLPLTEPDPPLFGREKVSHKIFSISKNILDDRLDNFFPQASSQWDALRHVRCREYGYFGGITDDSLMKPASGPLGIEKYAEKGIVGRGILVDIPNYRSKHDLSFDAFSGEMIEAREIENAMEFQGVSPAEGDILCIRTGWLQSFRALDYAKREELAAKPLFAGLRADEEMARYLWDSRVAAVGMDNPAIEASPGDPNVGSLHRRVLPLLGLALGELWVLDGLSEACQVDERWDFLFVSAPLNLPGGVGSPANALAVR